MSSFSSVFTKEENYLKRSSQIKKAFHSEMGSPLKPYAVLIPYPAQGHVSPMLQLAKLLHARGFYITYVNSEYNHRRLLRSRGSKPLDGLDDFRFEAIPDGLPQSDDDVTQDIPELCVSITKNCFAPFRDLLVRLNGCPGKPLVSCVIADGLMSFAQRVAEGLSILGLVFWATSACCCANLPNGKGIYSGTEHLSVIPNQTHLVFLFYMSYLTNGYLDTQLDWIPGMQDIRLKDISCFIRTTDRNDIMLNYDSGEAQNAVKARGVILNTFHELENDVVAALNHIFPHLYTIGPLQNFVRKMPQGELDSIGSNLWREDTKCLEWLEQ
ncbi:7-deoxyloganetin glucosyltransferase-like [Typha latifolia]|uniref:7-deoxyloganetin glucosyltransferase-like n=1 Tax=Typha latifolia TaxID=4733 RepID=UPI003C2C9732